MALIASFSAVSLNFDPVCPHRPCKKPLSPSCTVQMSDTKDSPGPIPLLAAALRVGTQTVLLGYGNHLQPVMEKVVSTQEAAEMHACLLVRLDHCEDLHVRVHQISPLGGLQVESGLSRGRGTADL